MRLAFPLFVLFTSYFLTGCMAGSIIKTPAEVKQFVQTNPSAGTVETISINRPYNSVVRDLKRGTNKCLSKTFKHYQTPSGIQIGGSGLIGTTDYITTANINNSTAEFYTTYIDNTQLSTAPENRTAFVLYLAEVRPKSSTTTTLQLWSWTASRYQWSRKFVPAWARGKNPGCPTLSGWF